MLEWDSSNGGLAMRSPLLSAVSILPLALAGCGGSGGPLANESIQSNTESIADRNEVIVAPDTNVASIDDDDNLSTGSSDSGVTKGADHRRCRTVYRGVCLREPYGPATPAPPVNVIGPELGPAERARAIHVMVPGANSL